MNQEPREKTLYEYFVRKIDHLIQEIAYFYWRLFYKQNQHCKNEKKVPKVKHNRHSKNKADL
jgi:hypothetical protein